MTQENKNWFIRHWFLTIILLIIFLGIISQFGESDSQTNSIESNKEINIEKTEGYTLDDCLDICDEAYDIQMQVDVCQGNCYYYGKPSDSMDRYVNTVKDRR